MGLDVLFSWLISKIEEFWPTFTLSPWEEGVRVFFGRWYKKVGSGVHIRIPFFTEVVSCDVKRQTVDCDDQYVKSFINDKVTIWAVSIALTFVYRNIVKAVIEVQDAEDSLVVEAQGIVAEWINNHRDEEITIKAIREDCYQPVRTEGFRWGLELEKLTVNSLAPTRLYRIVGDNVVE